MSGKDQTTELLAELQAMPLEAKIALTQVRLDEFYCGYGSVEYGAAYISFSGGKDSTVLLDIARKRYPEIRAAFSNTGLEYPEIRKFATSKDNVDVVHPAMRFDQVISKYGYPLIGKEVSEAIAFARRLNSGKHTIRKRAELLGDRKTDEGQRSRYNKQKWLPLAYDAPFLISNQCCYVMKKAPFNRYEQKNKVHKIVATMADESEARRQAWLKTGCNSFDGEIQSKPMSFWKEQDVLQYIVKYGLEICSVYGDIVAIDEDGNEYDPSNLIVPNCKLKCTGCKQTGCIFCAFGFHQDKGLTRFQRLARTHPRQYEYCMGGGQWVDNPQYDPTAPTYDGNWKNWNHKKIWVPSKKGLGMKFVFDQCNEIYGKDFYRYD